jgi:hypothetical protein
VLIKQKNNFKKKQTQNGGHSIHVLVRNLERAQWENFLAQTAISMLTFSFEGFFKQIECCYFSITCVWLNSAHTIFVVLYLLFPLNEQ